LYFARPWADWFALVLFVTAALTDFIDGYLARAWKQESKFGAMLDPIADKAMVIIAIAVLVALSSVERSSMDPWILMPATLILFREVFVSGLREYLGDTAGTLKVTRLAKWKTTLQMVAIAVLFAKGVFEHYLFMWTQGMDQATIDAILLGRIRDHLGLRSITAGYLYSWSIGVGLLWIAAALTLATGYDYLVKALPFLREDK
jgi:CDP-diacylglycerol--glycerol-3-phosphate 3-phosphatidyltransferase